MRIESNRPVKAASRREDAKKTGATGSSFAEALEGFEPTPQTAAAARPGALGGLLSLQEVPDTTERRRQAAQRGDHILQRLEELRLGLLAGAVSRDGLADLARTVREARASIGDPRLSGVLDEIELRARVELAKLEAVA
jgi:hypothetical protein